MIGYTAYQNGNYKSVRIVMNKIKLLVLILSAVCFGQNELSRQLIDYYESDSLFIQQNTYSNCDFAFIQTSKPDTVFTICETDSMRDTFIVLDFDSNGINDLLLLTVDEQFFHFDLVLFSYTEGYFVHQYQINYNNWIEDAIYDPTKPYYGLIEADHHESKERVYVIT
ncbi:MAG: hypothetical protein SCALA702_01310 [Melioribacteraceae bacterium]|nr:MAG: hypothetical protein SCALA702_01310 [Melioribacteraceae bacterium]